MLDIVGHRKTAVLAHDDPVQDRRRTGSDKVRKPTGRYSASTRRRRRYG
jgi:hypothetical protein